MTWKLLEPSIPMRNGVAIELDGEEQWANDLYVVHKRVMDADENGTPRAIHLSIRRQDREPCHDWRDFQRIKNQLAGPEWEGLEIYPAESRLVDMANQYHLWCLDRKVTGLGFGDNERLVGNQAQADMLTPGAVQRDPEPIDLAYANGGRLTPLKKMKAGHTAYNEKGAPDGDE